LLSWKRNRKKPIRREKTVWDWGYAGKAQKGTGTDWKFTRYAFEELEDSWAWASRTG